jgi:hypothetical protein
LRNSPSGKIISIGSEKLKAAPFIPYPELHNKTYFNALERILMGP